MLILYRMASFFPFQLNHVQHERLLTQLCNQIYIKEPLKEKASLPIQSTFDSMQKENQSKGKG